MEYRERLTYLKRPPEEIRLALAYPHLPHPLPFATAKALGPAHPSSSTAQGLYVANFEVAPGHWTPLFVPKEHHRVVEEYVAARERQKEAEGDCAYERWDRPTEEELVAEAEAEAVRREAKSELVPADGALTPRQALFCEHYARQPIATRAAVLAGFSEANAAAYGSRLLRNPLVLERIAKLREEQKIEYVVVRDTMHDKLEAVFFEAIGNGNHAAAVGALRLQANLAGMLRTAAPNSDAVPAKSQEKPR